MAEPGESLERLGDSGVVIRPDRVGIRSRHVAVEEDGDEAVQPLREAGRPLVCHGRDQPVEPPLPQRRKEAGSCSGSFSEFARTRE